MSEVKISTASVGCPMQGRVANSQRRLGVVLSQLDAFDHSLKVSMGAVGVALGLRSRYCIAHA